MDYEKKPKFKVGDTIRHKVHGDKYRYTIHGILNDAYVLNSDLVLTFNCEDSWELAEDMDEKIRKELIEYHKEQAFFDGKPNNKHVKYVAWLEKQGEQKPTKPTDLRTWKYIVDAVLTEREGIGNYLDNPWTTEVAEKLQKRFGNIEQNPTDKVEPKFEVGDWVIFNEHHNSVYQIEKIQCLRYYLRHYTGGSMSVHIDNQLIRHWTIQDAKAGDVLLSPSTPEGDKECPFIFKEIDEDGIVRFHVALLQSECISIDDGITNVMGYANAGYHTPATKEQRDLLFQKMKESGYEWDAEKKVLKKIEQEPAENEELTEFDKAVGVSIGTWNPKTSEKIQAVKSLSNKLLKLAKKQINNEQNPAWSEEDERMYRGLHNLIYSTPYCDSRKELSDWLKSLKDRVQPKPKQEWSEEDEQFLLVCKNALAKYQVSDKWDAGIISRWLENRLKSLSPHNTWKPSEEQMEALKDAYKYGSSSYEHLRILEQLYKGLKAL